MSRIPLSDVGNHLLQHLGADDWALLQPFMARTPLAVGQSLAKAGASLESVFFPEGAIVAVLEPENGGSANALGIVGCEGFVGWPNLLGLQQWPHDVAVRAEGASALVVDAQRLEEACRQSTTLRALLLRFVAVFMGQMSATLVSNAVQSMEQRLARWILLYHDRLEGDEIWLTHEEVGIMLGSRRASATNALHLLEGSRAIRNLRGRILIRDRAELERIAGHAYGPAERQHRELIGPFGKCAAAAAAATDPASSAQVRPGSSQSKVREIVSGMARPSKSRAGR